MRALVPLLSRWFRNPAARGWLLLGVVIYLISPLDLLPDLIPGLGQVDDLVVLGFTIVQLLGLLFQPPSVPPNPPPASSQSPLKKVEQTIDVEASEVQ